MKPALASITALWLLLGCLASYEPASDACTRACNELADACLPNTPTAKKLRPKIVATCVNDCRASLPSGARSCEAHPIGCEGVAGSCIPL